MIFKNGSSVPLSVNAGSMPDVSDALMDWFQPMTFTLVTTEVDAFQAVETPVNFSFQGVWQPFTPEMLMIKPEGQRSWKWFTCHAQPALILNNDDVILYLGTQFRVMQKMDWKLDGYVEYHLVEDYAGSGPNP